jgi:predicted ribosomally synthesized peptide with nif11-like leader
MSTKSAEAYVKRLLTDEEFNERIRKAPDAESRRSIIQSEGFDFTKEEADSVASRLTEEDISAISDTPPELFEVLDVCDKIP